MHVEGQSPHGLRNPSAAAERLHLLRQEKLYLDRENSHLSSENGLLRQTMRARATSMVNTRHRHSKYPQHDRKKYDQILETVHNDKHYRMFQDVPMKDLNGNIKRNENAINRNAHKIKKLDGEYKKNYLQGMKHESQGLWSYFSQTQGAAKHCACKHGEQPKAEPKKQEFNMNAEDKAKKDKDTKDARDAKELAEKQERDKKDREAKEAKEKAERDAKMKTDREAKEKAEKEAKDKADAEPKKKELDDAAKKAADQEF